MYDIIFVGEKTPHYTELKDKFFGMKYAPNFAEAQAMVVTKMFWVIWDDTLVEKHFDFSYTPEKWDQKVIHVFKNTAGKYDGICLYPKRVEIHPREAQYRFFVDKKEVDIVASTPYRPKYDIVFISYKEPNCEENYKHLLSMIPSAKRVHGVKGIHQAHIEAAKLCKTPMFYVVDGDACINDTFDFTSMNYLSEDEMSIVYVWRSLNPINRLSYGNGGVKLLPRKLTLNVDPTSTDMTTSISVRFKAMPEVSNISTFNTDPFNTWKSAFRECVKLSSKIIQGQQNKETEIRLTQWCTKGKDKPFGNYCIAGALAGKEYGEKYKDDSSALKKINNFEWLERKFNDNTID